MSRPPARPASAPRRPHTQPGSTGSAHPFLDRPHATFLGLSLPVLVSLVVEPFASLVDTIFVERLGVVPAAGLGAATALLSGLLWVFNFLGIGAQTETARTLGQTSAPHGTLPAELGKIGSIALVLAVGLGLAVTLLAWLNVERLVGWMSAEPGVRTDARTYLDIRLLGVTPSLLVTAGFGVLRGVQDMRTPVWIAGAMSLVNIVLDPVLIFGFGAIPALGIAGAAWATTISQFVGMAWVVRAVGKKTPLGAPLDWRRARRFFAIGRDVGVRTGSAQVFMLATVWTALQIGVEAGAAHQALRQLWMFLAYLLDAFAVTAQSLIGYFLGAGQRDGARWTARVACGWAVGSGTGLLVLLLLCSAPLAVVFVPADARAYFVAGLCISALSQPLTALAFVTDGIHWGTGDYAYLRNAMIVSTAGGVLLLAAIDHGHPHAFAHLWLAVTGWAGIRAGFGALRIWPGIGNAPLRLRTRSDRP